MKAKNLKLRIISSAIFLLIFIVGVGVHQYLFAGIFILFMVLCLWEFFRLFNTEKIITHKIYAIIFSLLLFTYTFFLAKKMIAFEYIIFFPALLFLIFIFEIFKKSKPFQNISYTLLGIFYIAVPFSLLNFLVFPSITDNNFTYKIISGFYVLIWAFDIGAYFFGSLFGKHLFFKRISPKKTWEGTIGGFIFSLLMSITVWYLFGTLEIYDWLVIAGISAIGAIFGDLTESMFKRASNIKDSGKIMPGHGGLLDRFDSSLFSIPFALIYIFLRFNF